MDITLVASTDKWLYPGDSLIVLREDKDGGQEEVARFIMPNFNKSTRYTIDKLEIREWKD